MWDEVRAMASVSFRFQQKSSEYSYASDLARRLQLYVRGLIMINWWWVICWVDGRGRVVGVGGGGCDGRVIGRGRSISRHGPTTMDDLPIINNVTPHNRTKHTRTAAGGAPRAERRPLVRRVGPRRPRRVPAAANAGGEPAGVLVAEGQRRPGADEPDGACLPIWRLGFVCVHRVRRGQLVWGLYGIMTFTNDTWVSTTLQQEPWYGVQYGMELVPAHQVRQWVRSYMS